MSRKQTRALIAVATYVASTSAEASDMAGLMIVASFPITGSLLLIATCLCVFGHSRVALGSTYVLLAVALLVAFVLATHSWTSSNDKFLYRWHLALTLLVFFPPGVLHWKLGRKPQ